MYPKFKIVETKDKNLIESITKHFQPYCDFNFSNIMNWSSPKNPTQFSILNGNLVIKMKNFTDDTQVITFIGENKVDDTVRTLTKDFKELKMIPEEVLGKSKSIKSKNYIIEEDLNNDDYILSLEDISGLRGRKFKSKRARVKKFLSKYPHHKVKILDHKDPAIRQEIKNLFIKWGKLKGNIKDSTDDYTEIEDELFAIEKLLNHSSLYNLVVIGVYVDNQLIGLTTNEIVRKDIAIGGFGKADFTHCGIFPYLEYVTAKELKKYGIKYLNYEQDLGIEGLRKSKLSWNPVRFLKKYKISKK